MQKACAPPLARPDFEDRFLGPDSGPETGTACPAPHCEVQGTRSRIWAGIWAQNPVLKIGPPGGPAGWVRVDLPGGVRRTCYPVASVLVGTLGRSCSLAAWLASLQLVPRSSPSGGSSEATRGRLQVGQLDMQNDGGPVWSSDMQATSAPAKPRGERPAVASLASASVCSMTRAPIIGLPGGPDMRSIGCLSEPCYCVAKHTNSTNTQFVGSRNASGQQV